MDQCFWFLLSDLPPKNDSPTSFYESSVHHASTDSRGSFRRDLTSPKDKTSFSQESRSTGVPSLEDRGCPATPPLNFLRDLNTTQLHVISWSLIPWRKGPKALSSTSWGPNTAGAGVSCVRASGGARGFFMSGNGAIRLHELEEI